jgi:pyruvate/2-oxoglutarate dehydrogenase complex dihydrolipoamide dehydrogenase (E3) component
MRLAIDAGTDAILRGMVLRPGGGEAVHEILMAMAARAPAGRFAQTMAIHPTISEFLPTVGDELSEPF